MRRLTAGLIAPLAVGALLLAGCTTTADPGATPGGADKETLTLGATLDMYGWDPLTQPGYQNWAADAVWDRLAACDATGGLIPGAAESWEISDDRKTFTAHLREGQEFSDGSEVDAAAVQATIENTANGPSAGDYEGVTFESPDPLTISITWPESQVIIENKICNLWVTPGSYIEAGEYDQPVGSGPYVLNAEATTTGSTYAFTKNPDYWNADNYPYQNLVIKVLENDAAAVSALKTNQIDATLVGLTSVEEVKASGFDVIAFKGQTPRLIISDHLGKVVPALGDVRVRQAMNMVFDKQAMADSLYLGQAEPTAQVFREGTPAYIENLEDPYPFDIEKAKALMAEAGYADGFSLEFPTMEGQNFETLLPYVKQQLAEINIEVTEAPLSGANAITDLLSGKYPVVLWQLGNLGSSAFQIYVESTPAGWWNLQHQPDEYVDSRYAKLATATPEESATIQQEINRYQIEQAWFAPFVYMGSQFAYNADKVQIPTQTDQEALTPRLVDFK